MSEKKDNEIRTSFAELPDGRLIGQVYNPITKRSRFAVWDGQKVEYLERVECNGKTYLPIDSDTLEKGLVTLPTEALEYGEESELWGQIRNFIHRHVSVDEIYELLASFYVLCSWVYDKFNALPYIRVMGDTDCGKTRFLLTVGYISYKPIWINGAANSGPIFRLIEIWKGTLVFDEADLRMSDTKADIVKILNCGYQRGTPVVRCNSKDYDKVEAYDTYCPKIIATREEFDDKALESRCLTHIMCKTMRDDISENLPPEFFTEALEISNKLLMWRFKHYKTISLSNIQRINGIEPRLNQIIAPLKAIVNDPELVKKLDEYVLNYNKKLIEDRASSIEGTIVRAILRLDNGSEFLSNKEILDAIFLDMGNEYKVSSEMIGRKLKALGFPIVHTREGNCIRIDRELLERLKKRYVPDESKEGGEGVKDVNVVYTIRQSVI